MSVSGRQCEMFMDYLYDNHRQRIGIGLFRGFDPLFSSGRDRPQKLRRGPTDRASAGSVWPTDRVYVFRYRGETKIRETRDPRCVNQNVEL